MPTTRACCSPAPPQQDQDQDQDHTPALDLLDEYWFFSNTLANNRQGSGGRRLLHRTPSPRVAGMPQEAEASAAASGNHQQQDDDDEAIKDDDLNWSSIYEGVLRTSRMAAETTTRSRRPPSALRRAPSMPVPSSAHPGKSTTRTPIKKAPPPSSGGGEQRQASHHQRRPVLARSKSVLQAGKTWRSSSDLESIEVQGFRDLGFVFDKEELRESLAGVLPGLKQQQAGDGESSSSRPYLSEAWRRPAALVRVQSDARSAAEMKDQLRMWAQAVACNMRQEC